MLLPVFCFAIGGKLIPLQGMANNFERYGLSDHMTLIGVGELIAFVLFIVPLTNSIGVLLLSAQMGGAIVTHMQHGEIFWLQSAVLILVWTAGIIANPSILGRFQANGRSRYVATALALFASVALYVLVRPTAVRVARLRRRYLDAIAPRLNTRPRKTLGYRTPADILAVTVALTG